MFQYKGNVYNSTAEMREMRNNEISELKKEIDGLNKKLRKLKLDKFKEEEPEKYKQTLERQKEYRKKNVISSEKYLRDVERLEDYKKNDPQKYEKHREQRRLINKRYREKQKKISE